MIINNILFCSKSTANILHFNFLIDLFNILILIVIFYIKNILLCYILSRERQGNAR